MDEILELCKRNDSQNMKQFLASISWKTFPFELNPLFKYWAQSPTFDANGTPYLQIMRATATEWKTVIEKIENYNISRHGFVHFIKKRIEQDKSEIEIEIKTKYDVPVVYNTDYGIYQWNLQLSDMMAKTGVSSENEHSFPRHHLFLVSCLVVLGLDDTFKSDLGIDFVRQSCIDFYRIEEYDGTEAIIAEPERAIAQAAKDLPPFDAPIDILRAGVFRYHKLVEEFKK